MRYCFEDIKFRFYFQVKFLRDSLANYLSSRQSSAGTALLPLQLISIKVWPYAQLQCTRRYSTAGNYRTAGSTLLSVVKIQFCSGKPGKRSGLQFCDR